MIFTIGVHDGTNGWEEKYDKPEIETVEEAWDWADRTVRKFNATLRPGERARTLTGVRGEGDSKAHHWLKTSLATQMRGNIAFDNYRCDRCGITGKRYGLSGTVKRDAKYRAKKYEECGGGN